MFIFIGNAIGSMDNNPSRRYTDLTKNFIDRVESDGGVVESIKCFNDVSWNDKNKDWNFMIRVSEDGGVLESFDCLT